MQKNLLIAEDDQFLASAYRSRFSKDFDVRIARDGIEAMEMIQQKIPDLILLDIIMPVKDGYSVLTDLKDMESYKNIPIIIASNLGQKEEIDKGLSLGANDYIVKSNSSLEDIYKKILRLLNE